MNLSTTKICTVSLLTLLISLGFEQALAQAVPVGEAVSPEHFAAPGRSRPFPRTRSIVKRYIEEKTITGEIDPTEYNQLQEQRKTLRAEMKALRESGDQAAIDEKMTELRQFRQEQRETMRNIVRDNPELQRQIRDQRQRARRHQLERRRDMIERRLERHNDRRERDGNS